MGRPLRYETDAERQAAYRERKKTLSGGVRHGSSPEKDAMDYAPSAQIKGGDAECTSGTESKTRLRSVAPNVQPVGAAMTKTDELFEAKKLGYWIYLTEPIERECWKCGKKFETRLELNKFCSPRCKDEFLTEALHARA